MWIHINGNRSYDMIQKLASIFVIDIVTCLWYVATNNAGSQS
jgi:hypothetical protein